MSAGSVSPFAVLGLEDDASLDEIKKAFRELSKEHHPDKNGNSAASKRNFQRLGEAFGCLDTEEKLRLAKRQASLTAPRRRKPAKPPEDSDNASTQAAPDVTYDASGVTRRQPTGAHRVDVRA